MSIWGKAWKKIAAEEAQDAYRAGLSWEAGSEMRCQRSERIAWWVAAVASGVALCAVIGIAMLAPLRRVVPYLYVMDNVTGNLEYVGVVDERTIKGSQELLDKYWAQVYINARESYYYTLLQADYDTVIALSDQHVGIDYARLFEGPGALDKQYGSKFELKIAIISLRLAQSSIGTQMVVRFSRTRRHVDTDFREPTEYFVATMRYQYRPSMVDSEKQLLRNPLGFKVAGYRRDAELSPVEAPAPIPTGTRRSP